MPKNTLTAVSAAALTAGLALTAALPAQAEQQHLSDPGTAVFHLGWDGSTPVLDALGPDGKKINPNTVTFDLAPRPTSAKNDRDGDENLLTLPAIGDRDDEENIQWVGKPGEVFPAAMYWNAAGKKAWPSQIDAIPSDIKPGSVLIKLVEVQGPSWVEVFTYRPGYAFTERIFSSSHPYFQNYPLKNPAAFEPNWLFGKPGDYEISLSVEARKVDGTKVKSNTITQNWHVTAGAEKTESPQPSPSQPTPSDSTPPEPSAPSAPGTKQPDTPGTPAPTNPPSGSSPAPGSPSTPAQPTSGSGSQPTPPRTSAPGAAPGADSALPPAAGGAPAPDEIGGAGTSGPATQGPPASAIPDIGSPDSGTIPASAPSAAGASASDSGSDTGGSGSQLTATPPPVDDGASPAASDVMGDDGNDAGAGSDGASTEVGADDVSSPQDVPLPDSAALPNEAPVVGTPGSVTKVGTRARKSADASLISGWGWAGVVSLLAGSAALAGVTVRRRKA